MDQEKLNNKDNMNLIVEAGLQLIPYVGSSISTLYFGNKQQKEFKRLENFYKKLNEELISVKEEIKNIKEQYGDGLVSLIEQVNEKILKEHQERKIDCYINYIKEILTNPVSPEMEQMSMYA